MKEKEKITNKSPEPSLPDRITAKNDRIQEKSDRIQARSERIARRNGTFFSTETASEKQGSTTETETAPLTQEIKSETPPAAQEIKTETSDVKTGATSKKAPLKKKQHAFNAAMLLSSISILLLVALFLGISSGFISLGDLRVIYLQLTDKTPTSSESFDSTPEMIEDFKNSVVIVSVERTNSSSTGTGIIVSSDGYIVTNYHVVEDNAVDIFVKLYKSAGYAKAELVGFSKHDDIAVLKIDKEGLRPATFTSSCADHLAGEKVFAIGAPEGTDYSWSVTHGILSAVNRELKFYGSDNVLTKKWRVMQTDAPVNPGNSGGPLIDSNGTVLGIITVKLENTEGMGFALPADGAMEIIAAIIEKGNADHIKSSISSGRPLIGVTCVAVEANVWYKHTDTGIEEVTEIYASSHPATTFHPEESGVYVKSTDSSRDAHGKLLAGDIITKANGIRVYTQYQLMEELYKFRGGDSVTITYFRDGEYYNVDIILSEAEIQ